MRVVTNGPTAWSVLADFLGAERPVFRGTLYQCLAFTAEHGV